MRISKLFLIALFILISTLYSPKAIAGNRTLGLGVMVGSATALSGKYKQSYSNAIAFGAAYYMTTNKQMLGFVDYLFNVRFSSRDSFLQSLVFYYGLGAIYSSKPGDSMVVGARVPLGVEWKISPALGLSGEVVPWVRVLPNVDIFPWTAVMLRYFF